MPRFLRRAAAALPALLIALGTAAAMVLPDGQVLVAGGISFHSHRATPLATAELYTP